MEIVKIIRVADSNLMHVRIINKPKHGKINPCLHWYGLVKIIEVRRRKFKYHAEKMVKTRGTKVEVFDLSTNEMPISVDRKCVHLTMERTVWSNELDRVELTHENTDWRARSAWKWLSQECPTSATQFISLVIYTADAMETADSNRWHQTTGRGDTLVSHSPCSQAAWIINSSFKQIYCFFYHVPVHCLEESCSVSELYIHWYLLILLFILQRGQTKVTFVSVCPRRSCFSNTCPGWFATTTGMQDCTFLSFSRSSVLVFYCWGVYSEYK